ncbi:hypothetical protein Bbelb_406680 [Branchiostoma belcheri]|nr:hypothetical protein Bbelb_406680 [Branchiostoma belcheri]
MVVAESFVTAQEAEPVTGWQLQPVFLVQGCKCYPVSNTYALTLTMPEHMASLSQQEFDSATEEAIVVLNTSPKSFEPITNSEQWTEAVTGISQGQLGEQQQEHLGHLDKKTLQDTAARHKRVCDITNSKTTSLKIHLLDDHVGKKREVREALFEHLKGRAAEDQEMWL